MSFYSLNRAQLIGNLTRDPELKQLPSGIPVATFTVATNHVWTDSQGVRQEKAEFHDIVAWRKLAEIVAQQLKKGSKVFVEGRLQTREWTPDDGIKRRKTEITADSVIILTRSQGGGMSGAPMMGSAMGGASFGGSGQAAGDVNAGSSAGSAGAGSDDEVSIEDLTDDQVAVDDLPF